MPDSCDKLSRPTDYTLLEQLRLTDREITRRCELYQITEADMAVLSSARAGIASEVQSLVDKFYEFQVTVPEISRLIGDNESLLRLKNSMRNYILDLFECQIDRSYVLSRLRIGQVHKRIGVPPKLVISAVRLMQLLLKNLLIRDSKDNCELCNSRTGALDKIFMFDMSLIFDTYIYSLMDEVQRGTEELESYAVSLEQEVAQRTRELSEMARRDGLTGLLNQRSFFEELNREFSRAQRTNSPISLVYMDVDKFKQINDVQGHHKGDEVLRRVSANIMSSVRAEDIAARYGGDEFVVILVHSTMDEAYKICARMFDKMKANKSFKGISMSAGLVTTGPQTYIRTDELVRLADQAMYQSKTKSGYFITKAKMPKTVG